MFDELLNPPPSVDPQAPEVIALIADVIPQVQANSTGSSSSTSVDQDAPSPSKSQTTPKTQSSVIPQDVEEYNLDIEVAHMGNDPLFGVPIPEVTSVQSSSTVSPHTIMQPDHQIPQHNSKWTKDHPLDNIIGQLSRPSVIPQDVEEYNLDIEVAHMGNDSLFGVPIPEVTSVQSSSTTYKDALTQSCWIEAMQEELNEFERLVKSKLDEDKEGKAIDPSHSCGSAYRKARTCSKRIFRYLRGTVHRCLWYPKDSSVALTAFAYADHAGCQDTRWSTSGSVQFLEERLISWSSKRTMDTTIDQQLARDEALVPSAKRLRIGRSNFLLLSDIKSKESTLQLVYDVLRLTPFFKVFLVTADVLEIYMQELWTAATVHHHSIRFKMDNKNIVNLESFREMLHICPRLPHQPFVEPPFEEEIFAFLRFHRPSAVIRKLTDVNINKLHQPWRSFAAIINKCLTGKSSGYDSLRLNTKIQRRTMRCIILSSRRLSSTTSCQRILLFQGETRNSNAYKEYYAVTTGVTPPKPKASVRKTRSSSDTTVTPPTDAAGLRLTTSEKGKQEAKASKAKSLSALSENLGTNVVREEGYDEEEEEDELYRDVNINQGRDIGNSDAYKEYYAVVTGATPPKTKASVRKTRSSPDTTVTPPPTAAAGPRLSTSAKGKQLATTSKAKSLSAPSKVAMIEAQKLKLATKRSLQQTHVSQVSGSGANEGTEEGSDDEQASDEKEFTHPSLSTHAKEETRDEESFDPIPKTPKNTDDEGNGEENLGMNVGREEDQDEKDEEDELYRDVNINLGRDIQMADVHTTQEVEESYVTLTPVNPDGQQQSSSMSSQFVTMAPLPIYVPTLTPSTIATITTTLQAPTPSTTAPRNLLQDLPNFGSLFGFDHRLKTLESNFSEFMQMNQFVGAISSIPGIIQRYMDHRMNEAVKVAVQIQSDRLHDEAQAENDDFLKTINENMQKIIKEQVKEQVKILIEKMEGNKSIQRSNKQRNLYKALVEAYESDKITLDTYGDTIMLKRRRDDANKDEEPSARSDRGSKRRREGKEPDESATAKEPMQTTFEMEEPSHPEFETGADDQPIVELSQHPEWFSQQKKPPTPYRDWNKTLPATYGSIQPWISDLAKLSDSRSSFNELMDTPVDFFAFLMNRLKVDTLTPKLLAGPTYELMKGSCKSLVELEFFLKEVHKATTDQLDWVNPEGASSRKYTTSVTKTKGSRLQAYQGVSHWRRKRQQFYGFAVNRESARDVYSKRRIIAITELKIVEWHNYKHLDWIMVRRDDDKLYKFKEGDFKRLHIQDIEDMLLLLVQGKLTNLTRRVEDLQLDVEIYQKKLNLTKPDTYRSDLKRKEAYIAKSDKDRATAMIHAIDKRLKTRRIMRSLERFVGGRLYEGDFRMLQKTI
nr:uncharacterized mitochondrial protein AtMg00810-like [Tanacetum cinerariifolium]